MIVLKKTKDKDNAFDNYDVTIELEHAPTLDEMLETFDLFLKALGYSYKGNLTIEEPENENE